MSGLRPDSRLTFFASPKKVSKERRPGCSAPWVQGVPCGAHKLGGFHANSAPSTRPQTARESRGHTAPTPACSAPQRRIRATRLGSPSASPGWVKHALRGQISRAAFGDLDIAGYKHMMRKQSRFQATATRISHAELGGRLPALRSRTVARYQS